MSNPRLIVAWQSPKTREYIPIGILQKKDELFCFNYTKGVEKAKKQGFMSFVSMSDFDIPYTAEKLFPTFANRILPKTRPEYKQYKKWLGLDENSGDLEELARNNGIKETDNIELYAIPQKADKYHIEFFSHGIRYLPPEYKNRVSKLKEGDKLYITQDLQNEYDNNALLIRVDNPAELVGYVPRIYAKDITTILKTDKEATLSVKRVDNEAILQFQLLCEFKAEWQDGFEPFKEETFEIIAKK